MTVSSSIASRHKCWRWSAPAQKPRSSSSSESKRSIDSTKVRLIKKSRDLEVIEAEITELEKRIAKLSSEMTKPEIARDITKLVSVNDEYERSESQLTLLLDEWERAETAALRSTKNAK